METVFCVAGDFFGLTGILARFDNDRLSFPTTGNIGEKIKKLIPIDQLTAFLFQPVWLSTGALALTTASRLRSTLQKTFSHLNAFVNSRQKKTHVRCRDVGPSHWEVTKINREGSSSNRCATLPVVRVYSLLEILGLKIL